MTKKLNPIILFLTSIVALFFLGCSSVAPYYKKTKQQFTYDTAETKAKPQQTYSTTFQPPVALADDFIWGINGHTTNVPAYYADGSLQLQIQLLKELQVTHYRTSVTLGEDGDVDYWKSEIPRWKETIEQCEKAGIKLLPLIIFKSADYELSTETVYKKAKKEGAGFARRYKNSVAAYAMGNEMDLKVDIDGKDGSEIAHYNLEKLSKVIAFLKGLGAGIREEDPAAKLIVNGAGRHRFGYFEYIKQQQVDYDIIGFHWYSEMGKVATPFLSERDGLDILKYMHTQFQKPIWITEINQHWGVDKHSEAHQAFWIDTFIDNLKARDYIKAFFVYELLDQPHLDDGEGYENERQAYFGIIDWVQPYETYRYRPAAIVYKYKIEEVKRGLQHYTASLAQKVGLSKAKQEQIINSIRQGSSPQKVLETVLTNEQVVLFQNKNITQLYQFLFHRNPTEKEEKYWQKQLEKNTSKKQLITILLSSQEFYKNAIMEGYEKNSKDAFKREGIFSVNK